MTTKPMGHYNIKLTQTNSHPVSVDSASEDEDNYPSHSQSGSSHLSEHPPHLNYPNEVVYGDSHHLPNPASVLEQTERDHHSRASSMRRDAARRQEAQTQQSSIRARQRAKARHELPEPTDSEDESEGESVDSTERFLREPGPGHVRGMSRPVSYHAPPNGYPQSATSAGYAYPQVPQSQQQLMQFAAQQAGAMQSQYPPGHPLHPLSHQARQHMQGRAYPPTSNPAGYPPGQNGHPAAMGHNPASYAGSHYAAPPYGGSSALGPYAPPQGYFPPAPYGYGGYPPSHPYPHNVPALPDFMNAWRVSPHPGARSAVSSSSSDKPELDHEALIKRVETIMADQMLARDAKDSERQVAIRSAEDQLALLRKTEQERQDEARRIRLAALEDARLQADKQAEVDRQRRAEEARLRLEVMQAAQQEAEARAKADKERREDEIRIKKEALAEAKAQAEAAVKAQKEREAEFDRIRKEATEAAQKAIAAAAEAKAQEATRDAKIREEAAKAALEEAAAAAKSKAEAEARDAKLKKEAADAAKAEIEEAAKKAKEEADKKAKEADEAAKAAKASAPPEKKAPVRFKDAIGRNYNFPWERCCKWRDMEGLIVQAFQHIEDLGEHVLQRRYDLIGPDKEIIMPEYWDVTIQPDMHITMMLWPLPEPGPLPGMGPGPHGGIVDLDDLFGPKKKPKKKSGGVSSAFSNWMLGGAPRVHRNRTKDKKHG